MHLDGGNSEVIDSMSRESIQTGWIHHLAHNFSNVASSALVNNPAGNYPGSGSTIPGLSGNTHHSLKFAADHHSPTGLKLHSDHSPVDPNNPHSQFTELRTAAQNAASVDAAGAWPPTMPNSYLAVAAASHNQATGMMHPASRNSFAASAVHPNASWAHARNAYGTQFTSAEQVAAAYRGCNLNIMNAVVAGGDAAAAQHHHNSTAAAAAAAMHAMPFYMTHPAAGNPMAPGGHPGVHPGQNPFVSPHHPYAASVAAAEMYGDHSSSTFRYNPTTGKTRTKDKYRVVYTDRQRAELENEFRSAQYITIRRKSELAMQVGLSERQVKIWFQNRRAKERKVSRKVPGGGNHSSSDIEDSDNEIDDEDEENQLRSPAKHQSLSPGSQNTCHNGVQLPLIKSENNSLLRPPSNELYGAKMS